MLDFASFVLSGQESADPRPRFVSSTKVIRIDVSVVDRAGHPIRDLGPSDEWLVEREVEEVVMESMRRVRE